MLIYLTLIIKFSSQTLNLYGVQLSCMLYPQTVFMVCANHWPGISFTARPANDTMIIYESFHLRLPKKSMTIY